MNGTVSIPANYALHGYHIVRASDWVTFPEAVQDELRKVGGFPVNDHFLTIWERPKTKKRVFLILYGTYGSSKTTDRIQELILECITDPYFKCYYGRQVFDLAKKEFHSSIVSTIKDLRLQDLFDFSESPNGSKVITCKANKNKFIPFGCDDPESIKGWDNPTHIMVDELNQISFKAFGMLQSRLRKMNAKKVFIGCFNNCDVFEDHWIVTELLNKERPLVDDKGNAIENNILEHFSLYTHNYFLDHEDYRNSLVQQAGGDIDRVSAILNGLWGSKSTGFPYYKMFSRGAHVGDVSYDPNLPLHISWDDNLNPYLPVGIFQLKGLEVRMIDEIAAKSPNNRLSWVCDELIRRYGPAGKNHKAGLFVYGDATSRKDDTKVERGMNFYTIIKKFLEQFKPQMRVSKLNPNVAMRGNFLNAIFGAEYAGIRIIIGRNCTNMIADLSNTSEAPDGTKDKTKTVVDGIRGVQRWGHFTDLLDYMVCYAYTKYYEQYQRGGKTIEWRGAKRVAHNQI